MKNNSILFSDIDREDGWVSSGLCFKLNDDLIGKSYKDIYDALKPKLEEDEVVQFVINDNSLDADLFIDDEDVTFKFKETRWEYALVYVFVDEEGYEEEFKFSQTDFILSL